MVGLNGFTGRLRRLEHAARPMIPDAGAELAEFLGQLSDHELRVLLDAARRAERGEAVSDDELAGILGPECWARWRALMGQRPLG